MTDLNQRTAVRNSSPTRHTSRSASLTPLSGTSHRRRQPERVLQTALVEHLRLRGRGGVLWLHVPNGGSRDIREAANLKRMGALAGASLEGFALELKSDGGRLTDAQREFLWRFSEVGGHTCVAENLGRALEVLERWQILRGRS
jgi:hypothetical protein